MGLLEVIPERPVPLRRLADSRAGAGGPAIRDFPGALGPCLPQISAHKGLLMLVAPVARLAYSTG